MLVVGGVKMPVVDAMLAVAVAPGGTYTTSADVPLGTGSVSLLVDVESMDDRQTYTNYHGYSVEL